MNPNKLDGETLKENDYSLCLFDIEVLFGKLGITQGQARALLCIVIHDCGAMHMTGLFWPVIAHRAMH